VSEGDRSRSQMFVECESAGWLTQCKIDQVKPQMLAPDRSTRYNVFPHVRLSRSLFHLYDRNMPRPIIISRLNQHSGSCNSHFAGISVG